MDTNILGGIISGLIPILVALLVYIFRHVFSYNLVSKRYETKYGGSGTFADVKIVSQKLSKRKFLYGRTKTQWTKSLSEDGSPVWNYDDITGVATIYGVLVNERMNPISYRGSAESSSVEIESMDGTIGDSDKNLSRLQKKFEKFLLKSYVE